MNEKQREILYKEFKVDDTHTISRGDYECLACPMVAWNWSDERMQELADYIGRELGGSTDEYDFAIISEYCAVDMGMQYYGDLPDEEYNINCKEWLSIE